MPATVIGGHNWRNTGRKRSEQLRSHFQAGVHSAGIGLIMSFLIFLAAGESTAEASVFLLSGTLFGFGIGWVTFFWDRLLDRLLRRVLGRNPLTFRVFNFSLPTFVVLASSSLVVSFDQGLALYSTPLLISAFASLGIAALYGTLQFTHEAFGQYVDKSVRDRVLLAGCDADGSQIAAAVVFIDVRDSTSIGERMAPEQLVELLNEFFEITVQTIQEHHGVVNKFIGDALMAFWANSFGSKQPCVDAASSALLVMSRVESMYSTWQLKYGCALTLGIGLHYGTVIAGNIGSPDRKEFTLIGDTVNTAKRLQELTKETHRRIHASAAFCLNAAFRCLYIGDYCLRGKSHPEKVYTLDISLADNPE